MAQKQKTTLTRILVWALVGIIALVILTVIIIGGRHYLTHRNIRAMSHYIAAFGAWSPVIVILLIFLSTAIPPLPLPIPIVEIAAGYMFGFFEGFLLIWFSQIVSSLFVFAATRVAGYGLFAGLKKNRLFVWYERYVAKNGAMGVFISRAVMAAPFNIVSFLAGLSRISILSFFVATVAGTIPESLIYPYLGNYILHHRVRLWYIFIGIVLLASVVPVLLFLQINKAMKKGARPHDRRK